MDGACSADTYGSQITSPMSLEAVCRLLIGTRQNDGPAFQALYKIIAAVRLDGTLDREAPALRVVRQVGRSCGWLLFFPSDDPRLTCFGDIIDIAQQ